MGLVQEKFLMDASSGEERQKQLASSPVLKLA